MSQITKGSSNFVLNLVPKQSPISPTNDERVQAPNQNSGLIFNGVIEETNEDENVDTFCAKERHTLSQADLTSFDNVVKNQRKQDTLKE